MPATMGIAPTNTALTWAPNSRQRQLPGAARQRRQFEKQAADEIEQADDVAPQRQGAAPDECEHAFVARRGLGGGGRAVLRHQMNIARCCGWNPRSSGSGSPACGRAAEQQPGAVGVEPGDAGAVEDAHALAGQVGQRVRGIGLPDAAGDQRALGFVEARAGLRHARLRGLSGSMPGMKGRPRSRWVT
jgi:hypothetical protein